MCLYCKREKFEMRIGLHLSLISLGQRGHFTYVKNLIEHLLLFDRSNQYVFFYNYFRKPPNELIFKLNQTNIKKKYYRLPARILKLCWGKFHFPPVDLMIGKVDVFHSVAFHLSHPDFYLPPRIWGKLIVTIHDIIPLKFPQFYPRAYVEVCRRGLALASKKASLIITDSFNSKNAIGGIANIKKEKVKVIPLAADEQFRPITDKQKLISILKGYDLPDKYILFVGGTNPTKNLTRLIEAFSVLKKKLKNEHNLVLLVERRGKEYEQIVHKVKELKLENDIILTGYISEEKLPYIYNGAELFVFPSLYEGFGLPPLEAMACGTPVITSNVSSLPEVVGDAAILVNPYNVEEIAEAMKRVLGDENLQRELSHKGLERTKLFSWEKTARETIKVYEELGESK